MKRNYYAEIEINPVRCTGCAMCVAICPQNVLKVKKIEGYMCADTVWSAKCDGCGTCAAICPNDAIEIESYRLTPVMG